MSTTAIKAQRERPRKGRFFISMAQRMVNSKFWSDSWVVDKLNALDRYLFLYLLTNERRNIIGIYECPLRVMAFETGIDQNDLSKMLERLSPKIDYLQGAWVYIKNAADHQADNPNINKGMAREVAALPAAVRDEVRVIGLNSLRLATAYDIFDEGVEHAALLEQNSGNESPSKPLRATSSHSTKAQATPSDSKPLPSGSGNLTKPNLTKPPTASSSPAGKPQDQAELVRKQIGEVFRHYIDAFGAQNSHIKLSPQRAQKIRARINDAGMDMLLKAIDNTAASPWHRGDNDRGWKANIDFIIRSYEQVEKLAALSDESTVSTPGNTKPSDDDLAKAMRNL